MKQIIAELDYEVLGLWALRPVFWVAQGKENSTPSVVIQLFHCHSKAKGNCWEYCGLVNKEEFKAGAAPQYECNACAEQAPTTIVEEKLLAAGRHEGYDPRNSRRSAVLATKNKRKR
jgi:hypothetical protein